VKHNDPQNSDGFAFRLDTKSGVPVYRQLIDQVQGAIASGSLRSGDQLPTVRLVAVELAINPNTVLRAYREMEIRGILDTQQGTGTFVADRPTSTNQDEKNRSLAQLVREFAARAGAAGLTLNEVIEELRSLQSKAAPNESTQTKAQGRTS
jgi:GntR family transcriptional regulator